MTVSGKDAAGNSHQFMGTGDFTACEAALEPLMNLTEPCLKSPCSLNGVHQPRIDMTSQFYGFSEFWYSMEDVFSIGGPYEYWAFHNKAKVKKKKKKLLVLANTQLLLSFFFFQIRI